ncbi:hypothetical protein ZIOFF_074781 [Zingiber officinale]|uniref:Leucine-rich repeat-containing N-terminal plant-type domain-containing protein n=1 Tax=Zingiber officinale TaxID=94328 RepID=A0A8J5ELC6_ZINOF|nr:hypothetical protein ZIOFF_074781 [Zingiber officinale]
MLVSDCSTSDHNPERYLRHREDGAEIRAREAAALGREMQRNGRRRDQTMAVGFKLGHGVGCRASPLLRVTTAAAERRNKRATEGDQVGSIFRKIIPVPIIEKPKTETGGECDTVEQATQEAQPAELSLNPSLQVLDLAHNNLFGSLPSSLGMFGSMMARQNKSKSSPLYDGHFYHKESLIITTKDSELQLTTLLSIVTSIDLSNNNISGGIPREIANLQGLHFFNLSSNYLSGNIPNEIGHMVQLESLDLSKNNLSGRIPLTISILNFLSILNLSYNNLIGKIPTGNQLQTFTNLSYIGNPELCGEPLQTRCPGDNPTIDDGLIDEEDMHKDDDHGGIWYFIGFAPGFVFGFWGFKERKALLNARSGFPDVDRRLSSWKGDECCSWERVGCNNITDISRIDLDGHPIPGSIGSLTQLQHLDLSHYSFKGEIPYQLGNLSNLRYLSLFFNKISGQIPASFAQLRNLQFLDLSMNSINGDIPENIGNLRNIQGLFLTFNLIKGVIPKSIGNLSKMSDLDHSDNRIVGAWLTRDYRQSNRIAEFGLIR